MRILRAILVSNRKSSEVQLIIIYQAMTFFDNDTNDVMNGRVLYFYFLSLGNSLTARCFSDRMWKWSLQRATFSLANLFSSKAYCDNEDISLVHEADAALKNDKPKIKTPMQYLELQDVIARASVHTFDGFRVQVQKQLNLNTVVSHL